MNLYRNYLEFIKTGDTDCFERSGAIFKQEINKIIYDLNYHDKSDLYQEILMVVHQKFMEKAFTLEDNILEYINIENYFLKKYLEKDEKNKKKYHQYLLDGKNEFIEEFREYIGHLKLIAYIKRIAKSKLMDYYRKSKKENIIFTEEVELDKYAQKNMKNCDRLIEHLNLNEREKNFLHFFLESDRIKTQKEVAQKLSTTQQAVSYQMRSIKNKIRK